MNIPLYFSTQIISSFRTVTTPEQTEASLNSTEYIWHFFISLWSQKGEAMDSMQEENTKHDKPCVTLCTLFCPKIQQP